MRSATRPRAATSRRTLLIVLATLTAALLAVTAAPRPALADPGTIQLTSDSFSGTEGDQIQVTVERVSGTEGQVFATYILSEDSATTPEDYQDQQGVAIFQDGVTQAVILLTTIEDGDDEGDETFTLTLNGVGGEATLGSPTVATITILDDDGPPTYEFQSADFSTEEGTVATITVVRTGSTDEAGSVMYATSNGTAQAGTDYTTASGTLDFGVGVASRTFQVATTENTNDEADKTVNLALSDPTGDGAVLGAQDTAVLTITDDDGPGVFMFGQTTYQVSESGVNAIVSVVRTLGSTGSVSVKCDTVGGGTATAGTDYTVTSQTLTFPAGDTQENCVVPILDDANVEGDETVNLALNTATGGATVGEPDTATLTIEDDDSGDVVEFDSADFTVEEDGNLATITVVRTGTLAGTVTVSYATQADTAAAGVDYTDVNGTVTFLDGEDTKTFQVPITNDGTIEGNETVTLNLSNPTGGATIGTVEPATLTILDDDGPPPTVTNVNPDEGPAAGGTTVTVTGTNFVNVTGVTFGGTAATNVVVVSPTQLTAVSPAHAAGAVSVAVTTPAGTSDTSGDDDTFTYTGGTPTITGISPNSGPKEGGTEVTITGTNLTGATQVSFGGVNSTDFTVDSPTQITATAPAHSAGQVSIRVTTPTGTTPDTAADNFTYTGGATITYTLHFRWELVVWNGPNGANVADALRGELGQALVLDGGSIAGEQGVSIFDRVTAIFTWSGTLQKWFAFFPEAHEQNIPGANDFATFETGRAYWIATTGPGSTTWEVPEG